MKKIFLLLLLSAALCANAQQGPNVPKDYSLKKAEDYKTYEQNVIDCIKWMRANHPDYKPDERKAAGAFVLQWTTGAPDVSLQLGSKYFTDISKDSKFLYSSDLAIMFMFGKTLYLIEHPDDKDEANAEYAGVKDMITLYGVITKKNPDLKSKVMERYIKLEGSGKLMDDVKKECDKTYKKK